MLREFSATLRLLAVVRAALPAAAALAVLLVAGCGIKGALRLPPAAVPAAPVPAASTAPAAQAAPVPPAETVPAAGPAPAAKP